jgi:hypothetical protein
MQNSGLQWIEDDYLIYDADDEDIYRMAKEQ